jgi:antitoxin FitA
MASLTINDLDPSLEQRLRDRASAHGRSIEAEVEAILEQSLFLSGTALLELADHYFGPGNGVDLELPPRGQAPRIPDFGSGHEGA